MEILDGTVIGPAAPAMADDLGVRPAQINLVLTAYLLTVATLIPGSGWLAHRYGLRRIFTVAIVIFVLASAGCALAPSLWVLVLARIGQGVGGALMVPVGRLAVLRASEKSALIAAIAYLTWPALIAPVVAPTIGGLLATYASWRWIFLINVPLGLIGIAFSLRLMPTDRGERRPLDWVGLVFCGAAAAVLIGGLELLGATTRFAVPGGLVMLATAAALGVGAVRHLRRTPHPLLELDTLRVVTFRAAAMGGGVFRLVIYALPFLLPLYFVLGFGWTAARAGLMMMALFAGNVGIKPLTTPIMRRFGIRSTLLIAVAMSAVCLGGLAATRVSWPIPALLALLVVSGVFRSVGFSAYNAMAFSDVPQERIPAANTLNAYLTELASGLGVAIGAVLLLLMSPLATHAWPDSGVPAVYRLAFVALALLLIIPFVEAARLSRSAASAVTSRP